MAKLLFLRDAGPSEVGGFGISNAHDLLLVEDIQLVEQICTVASVEFIDDSVADFFDRQVDMGRQPVQFARIWIHTHPGSSPLPSSTDEETFKRCFGGVDWAVMHIIAEHGATYTRAHFSAGPGLDRRLKSGVVPDCEFPATDRDSWLEEYEQYVSIHEPFAEQRSYFDPSWNEEWWGQNLSAADRWRDNLLETNH